MTGTGETAAFIETWLPAGRSIIEAGCGDGELAALLLRRGYRVLAVDADEAAVEAARERGVEARHASWPSFDPRPADAVVFTRSLHHIAELERAVSLASECAPLLLVEDFAFPEADPRLIDWIRAELSRLGVPWDETPHDIHSFAAMREAISAHFDIVAAEEVPYCYRYAPAEHAERLMAGERALGVPLLGRRVVGRAGETKRRPGERRW
ncbi:MAG TPA: methyltransferase domain-containing protein [Thermoanaerobaculia bacterium]|nr:methyltransferase domain-containing protein [Thermoanaerobaculia bacterium]